MPSSALEDGPAVELFVTPRTLRGTLGEAFVRSCVQLFERDHGPGSGRYTAIARTVELTVLGVCSSEPVAVGAGIADQAFSGAGGVARAPGSPPGQLTDVDVDALPGIGSLRGPAGVDLRRWAVIRMLGPAAQNQPADLTRLRIRVVTP